MARAVFFDRDGTLMHEVGYCGDPALVRVFEHAPAIVRRLREAGFLIVIVTNQSGIGRGYFTEADFEAVQREFFRQLDFVADATYFCPDGPGHPESRRKPSPAMLLEAARDLAIDLSRSFMVGDREGDIQAGRAAGCRTVLVLTGYGAEDPNHAAYGADAICRDLLETEGWLFSAAQETL